MAVSGVSNNAYTNASNKTSTDNAKKDAETTANNGAVTTGEVDTYEKGTTTTSTTYKPNKSMLAQLNAGQKAYIQGLQNLVSELVTQAGKSQQSSGATSFNASATSGIDPSKVESYWDLLVDNGDGTYSFDPSLSVEDQEKLIAKAKEDIGENGYYGVKQTSQRILDFAKAITGGDPSKIEDMRKMVDDAFESVKELAGGELPDISQQTYDAIMKGFDEWAASAE